MIDNKFYTWLDVLTHFDSAISSGEFPSSVGVEAYWDSVKIHKPKEFTNIEIIDALKKIFRARLRVNGHLEILLETPSIDKISTLPIEISEVEANLEPYPFRPTFKKPSILVKSESTPLKDRRNASKITAFYSFKGGVGRTLSAMSLTKALSESGKSVLLVDADLEAPGITWMLSESERAFSLTDFLSLIHGSEDGTEVVKSAAEYLKNQRFKNITILPAFRYKEQMNWLEIRPEHIVNFSVDPFRLTNILLELADELKIDNIVLDLRAGISELSSGWLLDPEIQKVFVTTLSSQSLSGTNLMIEFYSKLMAEYGLKDNEAPFIIFSQVPEAVIPVYQALWNSIEDFEFLEKNETKQLLQELKDTYIKNFLISDKVTQSTSPETDFSPSETISDDLATFSLFLRHHESLNSLPQQLDLLFKEIHVSKIDKEVFSAIKGWLSPEILPQTENIDLNSTRKALLKTTEELIYAEKQIDDQKFLITTPIEKLITEHKSEVPISVIIGAKGSGKTFLYRQIVQSSNWKTFSEKAKIKSGLDANLFPVILPKNIGERPRFKSFGDAAKKSVQGSAKESIDSIIIPDIEKSLSENLTPSQWRNKWLDYISWAVGFNVGQDGANDSLVTYLQSNNLKIIGVVDGLEEMFDKFHESDSQQSALSALLQDVPNWLDSIPGKPLGLIIFIRQDILTYAIKQNIGQFTDRYREYQLNWNSEEVLRLVYWILKTYNIGGFNYAQDAEDMKEQDLVEKLYFLWGKRMAKEKSKEAYSHKWILSQLANLKGEIQSRDMVRFLADASKNSEIESDTYRDRILLPGAVRKSVQTVGQEKINEVTQENKSIMPIFEKLRKLVLEIKFPCKKDDLFDISEKEIKLLEENGVLLFYRGEYYMAELYRRGFGFEYSRKGKPKSMFGKS